MTSINTLSTLCELVRITEKTSAHISQMFENSWLARYPLPVRVIHDMGGEFIGPEFQSLLANAGIQAVPTTAKNPQSNAVCERLHHTIGDMLRALVLSNPPVDVAHGYDLIDSCLASAQFAARAAVHTTLDVSPGALSFQRDMILPIPLITNVHQARERRQTRIDENNRRENLRRRYKDYAVGDEILQLVYKPNKMAPRAVGPYIIQQVHTNGTVTIIRSEGVYERINIRRIKPYYR